MMMGKDNKEHTDSLDESSSSLTSSGSSIEINLNLAKTIENLENPTNLL